MPKETPHAVEEKGGMDLSGLVMSNGVAVRDTRHVRRFSPELLKYAFPKRRAGRQKVQWRATACPWQLLFGGVRIILVLGGCEPGRTGNVGQTAG